MLAAVPGEYTAVLGDYLPPWVAAAFFGIPLAMLVFVAIQDYRARHEAGPNRFPFGASGWRRLSKWILSVSKIFESAC